MFHGLLMEAVTESGEGNWLYPTLQRYLSWCDLVCEEALDVEWNDTEGRYICEGHAGFVDTSALGSDVIPAASGGSIGLPFVRTGSYFRDLLHCGPSLATLTAISANPEQDSRAKLRGRAAAAQYMAQMCRLNPRTLGGGDQEASAVAAPLGPDMQQRARLLLDARLPDQLIGLALHPGAGGVDVRQAAMLCAREALVHGFAGGTTIFDRETNNPGALLATGFTSRRWTAAIASVLRNDQEPFETRRCAFEALRAMAAAGATSHWTSADVSSALVAGLTAEAKGGARRTRQVEALTCASLRPFCLAFPEHVLLSPPSPRSRLCFPGDCGAGHEHGSAVPPALRQRG